MVSGARAKVYVEGSRGDLRVPFSEVGLGDSPGPAGPTPNPPLRLYDTSGPGAPPAQGLAPLRRAWILERGDVEPYRGRAASLRDDGRAAVRRAAHGPHAGTGDGAEDGAGRRAAGPASSDPELQPLRAKPGRTGAPLHYARPGEGTPEVE